MFDDTTCMSPRMAPIFGLFCFRKSVIGPSTFWIESPLKLLVRFSMPPATLSSFFMITFRSGDSSVSNTPSAAKVLGALPMETETKFAPTNPEA